MIFYPSTSIPAGLRTNILLPEQIARDGMQSIMVWISDSCSGTKANPHCIQAPAEIYEAFKVGHALLVRQVNQHVINFN